MLLGVNGKIRIRCSYWVQNLSFVGKTPRCQLYELSWELYVCMSLVTCLIFLWNLWSDIISCRWDWNWVLIPSLYYKSITYVWAYFYVQAWTLMPHKFDFSDSYNKNWGALLLLNMRSLKLRCLTYRQNTMIFLPLIKRLVSRYYPFCKKISNLLNC